MIKAVIFDVDGVLVDSFEANFKFFTDLMNKFGYKFFEKEEYLSLIHMTMKDVIRKAGQLTEEDQVEKIWRAGKNREVVYPDELLNKPANLNETIDFLSKKYELGIVTSRIGDHVFTMSNISDLKDYFKMVVGYEDTYNHKPHPDPLFLIAQKLGLRPEECVYIGDTESDIIAAKAAGMKAVLYHKEKLHDADANFFSFPDLPGIIGSI